jgi:hypothetical protein
MWYGIVLWQHANGGDQITLTAPVFGSLVAVFGAVLAVMLGGIKRVRPDAVYFDRLALIGLAMLLVIYGVGAPDLVARSLDATLRNVTYDGLWLVTWIASPVLLVVALAVHRIPDGRLWTVPIVGFGLLYWLLPLLRDGAWRVGAGDSGNRILAHILPVVAVFLVVAALGEGASPEKAEPEMGSGSVGAAQGTPGVSE